MSPPIYIHFADTQEIFHAWRTSQSLPATSPEYAPHRILLFQKARAILSKCDPTRTPLILATTKADIDTLTTWIRTPATPPPTPPTLSDEATSLARDLALAAPAYVVSAACASGLVALIDAALTVQHNQAPSALVLGIDVAGSFVRDGFHALKAISLTACRPFDTHRDGLALGSATAAALVSHEPSGCRLSGWAAASDAVHLTAPDRHANGLIRAIRLALDMARLQPTDVDVILAHGTGTRYNDAMEALAFQTFFPPTATKRPAITAVKGLIGHTLGACGLIESALAANILTTQIIPPITNLQSPEYPNLDLVSAPLAAKVRHILKVASGFGGLNAALILSDPGGGMSHIQQIVAGEGNKAWDLTDHLPSVESIIAHWRAPSFHAAVQDVQAHSIPQVAADCDPLAQLSRYLATYLLTPIPTDQRENTAIILATTFGCLRTDIDFDLSRREANARYASPAAFRNTLPTHIPAELSVKLSLRGPVFALSGPDPVALALQRATTWNHPLTLTGAFDHPPNAEPRGLFVLLSHLA